MVFHRNHENRCKTIENNENQAKSRKFKENHGLAAQKIMQKIFRTEKSRSMIFLFLNDRHFLFCHFRVRRVQTPQKIRNVKLKIEIFGHLL